MATKKIDQKQQDRNARKQITSNRRARFEYEILENVEAGLVLVGTEVKSLRAGQVNIQDGFARIENGELWLYNVHIAPYEQGNRYNEEPLRKRKLLLHSKEIIHLQTQVAQKGLSLIPLSMYFRRGFAKLDLGLGRGKKLFDKRESIAERDRDRQARREVASND